MNKYLGTCKIFYGVLYILDEVKAHYLAPGHINSHVYDLQVMG